PSLSPLFPYTTLFRSWMAEVSVAKLFFAGFLPGFIACGAMMALCYYHARKYNLPVEQGFSLRAVGRSTIHAFWALMIPIVIWGRSEEHTSELQSRVDL